MIILKRNFSIIQNSHFEIYFYIKNVHSMTHLYKLEYILRRK